jgi:hypothetical protein
MSVDFFRYRILLLSYSLYVFYICVDGVDGVDGFLRPRFGKKFSEQLIILLTHLPEVV